MAGALEGSTAMTTPIKTTPWGSMLLPGIITIRKTLPPATCECGQAALLDTVTIQVCESNPNDPEIPFHMSVAGHDGGERICADCLPGAQADWALGVLVIQVV